MWSCTVAHTGTRVQAAYNSYHQYNIQNNIMLEYTSYHLWRYKTDKDFHGQNVVLLQSTVLR